MTEKPDSESKSEESKSEKDTSQEPNLVEEGAQIHVEVLEDGLNSGFGLAPTPASDKPSDDKPNDAESKDEKDAA
jgi:hypothetical protein